MENGGYGLWGTNKVQDSNQRSRRSGSPKPEYGTRETSPDLLRLLSAPVWELFQAVVNSHLGRSKAACSHTHVSTYWLQGLHFYSSPLPAATVHERGNVCPPSLPFSPPTPTFLAFSQPSLLPLQGHCLVPEAQERVGALPWPGSLRSPLAGLLLAAVTGRRVTFRRCREAEFSEMSFFLSSRDEEVAELSWGDINGICPKCAARISVNGVNLVLGLRWGWHTVSSADLGEARGAVRRQAAWSAPGCREGL